ncbi:MAG: dTMP kinase [Candidatus Uhrbacteria bacterium]|nr:dTMP kinase [Candidatus Uhrbacteria bacterium]
MSRGMYIVFEGVVGTGKTTQAKLLVERLKQQYPDREVVGTREPGGSEIAEAIRVLVQGTPFTENMDPICEAYLYASARAQSLRAVVLPVIERGGIVVADRSFCTSVAWQGAARGLGTELVLRINESAIQGCLPDAVIEIDLDPVIGLQRTFDKNGDKFESMPVEFFHACARGYQELSEHPMFAGKWHRVSGEGSIEDVSARIREIVSVK